MMTKILFLLANIAFIYSQFDELRDCNSIFANLNALLYINIVFSLIFMAIKSFGKATLDKIGDIVTCLFIVQIIVFCIYYFWLYTKLVIPFIILLGSIMIAINIDEYRARK